MPFAFKRHSQAEGAGMFDGGGKTVPRIPIHLRVLLATAVIAPLAACRRSADPNGAAFAGPVASQPTSRSLTGLPRTTERQAERHRMVVRDIAGRGIREPRVLEAMRNVPRHWFVPIELADRAYDDGPLPIGFDQTISQPYIVALMTELLEVKPGEKVLEIGTGSGYQAAVLAELTDHVYTIEIVEPLAKRTIKLLKDRGYDTIRCRIGDGYRGWPEDAPFDSIIVTCAPESPPPELVKQLAPQGRMCVPIGPEGGLQELVLLRKQKDGKLTKDRVAPVRFVPMTGQAAKTKG